MNPSAPSENPSHGEFFASAEDLADRFVRESIQNSLDAPANFAEQPVRIRFSFNSGDRKLSPEITKLYLNGLEPHLRASYESLEIDFNEDEEEINSNDEDILNRIMNLFSKPMNSLVVEDFGTTGLTGSIMSNGPSEKGNNFWGFFRSIGISTKSEDDAGSWGLGKWVFSDASQINSIIGATITSDNLSPLVMGQAMLVTHMRKINGEDDRYPPYGWFAAYSSDIDGEWLPLPVGILGKTDSQEEKEFIRRLFEDFNLERKKEPGLSIIIPFPKVELTSDSIAQATVVQYFLPIIKKQLIVEIVDYNGEMRIIDAESIVSEAEKINLYQDEEKSAESILQLIDLALWSLELPSEEHIEIDAQKLSEDTFSSEELGKLSLRFESCERLGFSVNMNVAGRDSKTQRKMPKVKTGFKLYLQRDTALKVGQDYYTRGHLHISNMDNIKDHTARSLVIVDEKTELGHLLRDSEGPAHVSWNTNEAKLKKEWVSGPDRVREVRKTPGNIIRILTSTSKSAYEDYFADIFPSDITGNISNPQEGNGTDTDDVPDIPHSDSLILDSTIKNGFKFSCNDTEKAEELIGKKLNLIFAYDLEDGSKAKAFKNFKTAVDNGYPDFSLFSTLVILEGRNCTTSIISENKIQIEIHNIPFDFSVTGFDDRDIISEIVEL